jgi:hypothetical protein
MVHRCAAASPFLLQQGRRGVQDGVHGRRGPQVRRGRGGAAAGARAHLRQHHQGETVGLLLPSLSHPQPAPSPLPPRWLATVLRLWFVLCCLLCSSVECRLLSSPSSWLLAPCSSENRCVLYGCAAGQALLPPDDGRAAGLRALVAAVLHAPRPPGARAPAATHHKRRFWIWQHWTVIFRACCWRWGWGWKRWRREGW